MEVHHHSAGSPGHQGKKWTHYLWEFLMLFLAVFCGFLAENIREQRVEGQRARQLARNLYKELYSDSITIENCLVNRVFKEKECRYFINYVKDSNLAKLSPRFFPAFTTALIQIQYIIFEPNDGILNQLRNSGEMRYFDNAELQSEIGNLSVKIAYVRTRNDKEYSYIEFYQRPFTLKHFDFDWYEDFTKNGAISLVNALKDTLHLTNTGALVNPDTFSRQEARNIASYTLLMLRSTRQIQYREYVEANHRVMELLRKEYHSDK